MVPSVVVIARLQKVPRTFTETEAAFLWRWVDQVGPRDGVITSYDVAAALSIPLIHIADETAAAVKAAHVKRPLLLATRFTMERDFYRDRLAKNGVETIIPDADDRARLHAIIFDELVKGIFSDESRRAFLDIVERARARGGVDGAILGCTEFGMLAPPDVLPIPAFDTALIHAQAAMDFALSV